VSVTTRARRAGRQADRSEWMDYAVRVGLVAFGAMHLLVAWLALRLALGHGSGSASSQGAFHQLAQTVPGRISLFVAGAGFGALVVWQALEAVWGHRDEDGGKRVVKRLTSAGKAVVYACLAGSAVTTATGGSSGGGGTDGMTARLMRVPAGQVLVAVVGIGILVVAGALVWRGCTGSFSEKLDADGRHGSDGRAYLALGRAGYVSKGVAIALVGVLFLYAALTHDPKRSGGLDVALHKVLQQPYGGPLLVVIALGLACYGLFCFAWARHLSR
jgi:Domain of Unknown Function (DUF1206)